MVEKEPTNWKEIKIIIECAVILPNSLVSSNVLYGTEALYNITECEMREIENIKEVQMRNTGIQVPHSHVPVEKF